LNFSILFVDFFSFHPHHRHRPTTINVPFVIRPRIGPCLWP
jgi:hypothetical protein